MKNELLNEAIKYCERGYSVIPIGVDKKPLIEWKEYQSRRATKEEIIKWFDTLHPVGIGLVTGKVSGFVVLDIDVGADTQGLALPPTPAVKTGGGGQHHYYKHLSNTTIQSHNGFRYKMDFKAEGGYVIAPPSLHKSGNRYEWSVGLDDEKMAEMPQWIIQDILQRETSMGVRLDIKQHVSVEQGNRNVNMHKLACSLYAKEYTDSEAIFIVSEINRTYKPPLDKNELEQILNSAKNFIIGANQKEAKFEYKPNQGMSQAVITCLADIQPVPVSWLWSDRIALGKLTLIAGDPGLGKSLLTAAMAAVISKGYLWPVDKTPSPIGDVILLSAEDDPADTIRPRLDAAEADCKRIHIVKAVQEAEVNADGTHTERMFSLKRDIPTLNKLLASLPNCRLLIIDPISAYLDGTDSHNNSDVRGLLAPLSEMATHYKVAVVLVHHLNKGTGSNAMYRTMGSLAFTAAVRAAYVVTADKDNPKRRLVLQMKNNIAKDNTGLAYSIIGAENGAPVLLWESEPVLITANEALSNPERNNDNHSATDEAINFLCDLLSKGPVKVADAKKEAREAGISEKTLRSARERLGIRPEKSDFKGGWMWSITEDAQSGQEALTKSEGTLDTQGHLRGEESGKTVAEKIRDGINGFNKLPEVSPPQYQPPPKKILRGDKDSAHNITLDF